MTLFVSLNVDIFTKSFITAKRESGEVNAIYSILKFSAFGRFVYALFQKVKALIAEASRCTSSMRTEIAVASSLNFCCCLIMALSEAASKKLFKREITNLALDYQRKFNSTLTGTRTELSDLKKHFEKLSSDLPVAHENKFVADFKEKVELFNSHFATQCSLICNSSKLQ